MYNGLTTADKDALLDAKQNGAEWIARDENGMICGYATKPSKYNRTGEWYTDDGFELITKLLKFIKWSDHEPVNIDLALAQIAEMEGAEKPKQCEYCAKLSRYAGWGYAEWFEQTAVDDVYEISVDVKFCPNCGNPINSPYTEGATK